MAFWDKEKEVHQEEKVGTKSGFYSFKFVEKSGREFVDVREHFTKADGTVQHTTKGMSIPAVMFENMAVAFNKVQEMRGQ